jgi:dimethylargininase
MAYPSPHLSFARRILGALATGLTVAVLAHAATVFVFFVTAGADPTTFSTLSDFFITGSLFAFVLLSVAAVLEVFRWWFTALGAGIVIAAVSAYFGSMLTVVANGTPLDAAVTEYLAASLIGPNLILISAFAIVSATAGVAMWRLIAGRDVASDRRIALVRLPSSNLADGQLTHIERSEVNTELADRQWEGYVAALTDHGWNTVEIPVAEGHADSVFIEDTVVLFGSTAVIANPGAPSRAGESEAIEASLAELRLKPRRIEAPGTLDGGDVLKAGRTVYVGSSSRTNAEGIRQLRAIVTPLGYTVVGVPVARVLHLKSAVSALPDGTVIGFPSLLDDTSVFERFLAVPEAQGGSVVVLDNETVLMSAAAPQSAALIESLGYEVVTVDISEFEKLEGGVTCLSVRVR